MNIVFGDAIKNLPDNFTVLELDTFFYCKDNTVRTAFCVLEQIPLHEFVSLANYRSVHETLLVEYRKRNWEYCRCAIKELKGRWNGSLDSFYDDLLDRVIEFESNPPGIDWLGYRSVNNC